MKYRLTQKRRKTAFIPNFIHIWRSGFGSWSHGWYAICENARNFKFGRLLWGRALTKIPNKNLLWNHPQKGTRGHFSKSLTRKYNHNSRVEGNQLDLKCGRCLVYNYANLPKSRNSTHIVPHVMRDYSSYLVLLLLLTALSKWSSHRNYITIMKGTSQWCLC